MTTYKILCPRFYMVGGCVRDKYMGKQPKDRDWVVVGATPEWMEEHGFKQVGADFPVFLHPETGEEYALARTERKTGRGYKGFETAFGPEVTLEQDLFRRDLTINAIAEDEHDWCGLTYDPFNGREDIKNKVLRHVSEAFAEDPVRVLRVARFAARWPDFTIAPETIVLMKRIVSNGEMEHLTRERTSLELMKVIEAGEDLGRFIEVLHEVGAFDIIWPELYETCGPFDGKSPRARFTQMVEHMDDIREIRAFAEKNKIPTEYAEYAVMCSQMMWFTLTGSREPLVEYMTNHQVYNNPKMMLDICDDWEGYKVFREVYEATKHINFDNLSDEEKRTLKGAAIREAIVAKRKAVVA